MPLSCEQSYSASIFYELSHNIPEGAINYGRRRTRFKKAIPNGISLSWCLELETMAMLMMINFKVLIYWNLILVVPCDPICKLSVSLVCVYTWPQVRESYF